MSKNKKSILFDFISLQDEFLNGGMLYTQKIFNEIIKKDVIIYGLYDGNIQINSRIKNILNQENIELINIRENNIFVMINSLNINTLFIGIAQRFNQFNLCNLKCKIIIVCHDLFDLSLNYFKINKSKSIEKYSYNNKKNIKRKKINIIYIIKLIIKILFYPCVLLRRYLINKNNVNKSDNYQNFMELIKQDNVFIITDSEYSKYSILYFFNSPKNIIKIFYAPAIYNMNNKIETYDTKITEILNNIKYFLLISVDRHTKNAVIFLEQWEKFCLITNYTYHCVLIGKNININLKNCIIFNEVNSEELAYLYKNAFAFVYASFIEGFGYPPIEAAMYGTPSICANVTSIPEICGDMPIYFSPFYPEDLFKAMIKMTENREHYIKKTKNRYLEINQRQENDLNELIDFISE